MNGPVWLGWLMVILLSVISVLLLSGKASFLIAGYNTSGKEKNKKIIVRRLNFVIGSGFSLMTVLLAVFLYYEGELPTYLKWIFPGGYLVLIGLMLILSNTICRKKITSPE